MSIKERLRRALRRFGYDVVRFPGIPEALARRKQLLETAGIDVVLDVGANTGQYARELRHELGYQKKIVSFEPTRAAFRLLEERSRGDALWRVLNLGLGDSNERRLINVAGNSWSSSLLEMLPSHVDAAPESRYVARELVDIRTLDSVFDEVCTPGDRCYLKIDTQGFERQVIAGTERCLAQINMIQVEMSLIPLYAGELLFTQMHDFLGAKDYALVSIEPGFFDERSGQLLQVDGIFKLSEHIVR